MSRPCDPRPGIAAVSGLSLLLALLPGHASGSCEPPGASEPLKALHQKVGADPAGAIRDADLRLAELPATEALAAAQLLAIKAEAYDLLDDDANTRDTVALARARLARVSDAAAARALGNWLTVVEADAPRDTTDMAANIEKLSSIEPTLARESLERSCLLIVRSRLNTQLQRDEDATVDALSAYEIAEAARDSDLKADAAYELAFTFLRAGLFEDAQAKAAEAAAYHRTEHRAALLANDLYIDADTLSQLRRFEEALHALGEVRALNASLGQSIDVAFDDQKACEALVELGRFDAAEAACQSARGVLGKAGRADLVTVIDGSLARIDLARGRPRAAVDRLAGALGGDRARVPARTVTKLLRLRAEAYQKLGEPTASLTDLEDAMRLQDAADAGRHTAAAARIKERASLKVLDDDRKSLAERIKAEQQRAELDRDRSRLQLIGALAAVCVLVVLAYALWIRSRHERARRLVAESVEAQAHILSTIRDGVLVSDDRGIIEVANGAAERLLGRPKSTLCGSSLESLGLPGVSSAAVSTGTDPNLPARARDCRIHRRPGDEVVLLVAQSPITLHGRPGAVVMLHDVTDLRRLEQDVLTRSSGERFQASEELHEGIAQDLAGITLLLTGLRRHGADDKGDVDSVVEHARQALDHARSLAERLSPTRAAGGSLFKAVSLLDTIATPEGPVSVYCTLSGEDLQVSATQGDFLHRLVLECAQVVVAGCECQSVDVRVDLTGDSVRIDVESECDVPTSAAGATTRRLERVEYLVRLVNGSVRLDTRDAKSTRCTLLIPKGTIADGR